MLLPQRGRQFEVHKHIHPDKQWYKRVTNPITVGYYLLLCQLSRCVKALQPLSFHSLLDSLIRQACNVGVPEVCHCWNAPAKQSQLLPEYQSFRADKNAELLILHEAFHVHTQACRCTFPASEVMNESFMHNKTERWELRRAVEAHSLPSVSSNQYVQQSTSYWHFQGDRNAHLTLEQFFLFSCIKIKLEVTC